MGGCRDTLYSTNVMADYYHEDVTGEGKIPALMASLQQKEIQRFFPNEIFIPFHWHRSLELSLIENAEVILQVGQKELLIKNDFTCVNSGMVHALRGKTVNEDVHCFVLVLSYEFMKQYYPDIDQVYFDLSVKKDHDDLIEIYRRIEKQYLNQDQYSYLDITASLLELFSLLLREYKIDKPLKKIKSIKTQEQVKNVLNYIHNHYQESLSLTDIADQFYMSNEHFSRQFHHYVGQTFRDYLFSYRLYKAYEDVIHSEITIQDIARIHGFTNVKSFIKAFHDTYHQTPLQYRKKYFEKSN